MTVSLAQWRWIGWSAAVVVAFGAYVGWRHSVRHDAQDALIVAQQGARADSLKAIIRRDSVAFAGWHQKAVKDSLALMAQRSAVTALAGRVDAAQARVDAEHEQADRVLRDSAATVPQVKGELVVALAVQDSLRVASQAERTGWLGERKRADSVIAGLRLRVDKDSVDRGHLKQENDATARQVAALQRQLPSMTGTIIRTSIIAVLAFEGGQHIH